MFLIETEQQARCILNNFQAKCLKAFFDLKSKDTNVVRIAIIYTTPGIAVELKSGDKVFYTLAAIMDPVERLLLSPANRISA